MIADREQGAAVGRTVPCTVGRYACWECTSDRLKLLMKLKTFSLDSTHIIVSSNCTTVPAAAVVGLHMWRYDTSI